MSAELYKFLRKAVMNAEPGADRLMRNMTRSARHDILSSLAHVRPAGEVDHGFMLAEELPWLGDKAKEMVRASRAELRNVEPIRLNDTSAKAREMYHEWIDSRPWRRQ